MPSTFTTSLRLELQSDGENANTWGSIERTSYQLIERAIVGSLVKDVSGSSDVTLTTVNGGFDEARNAVYAFTGTLTGNINVIVPSVEKLFYVLNNTTGAFTLTVKTAAGTGIAVPQGKRMALYSDGTNVLRLINAVDHLTVDGSLDTSKGVAIASAGTTNIWSTSGNLVHITGTTTITSFGTAPRAGTYRDLVFDAVLTITQGVNLLLPGGVNIVTQAGDTCRVYAETPTQHRVVSYQRADGSPVGFVEVLKRVYPVGSLYFNGDVNTNPATLLGFGTWAAFGAGRVPVGIDAGQTEFNTLGEVGGAKTHTLTEAEMPSHLHASGTLDVDPDTHTHSFSDTTSSDSHSHTLTSNAPSSTSIGGSTTSNIVHEISPTAAGSTVTTSSDAHTHTISGTTGASPNLNIIGSTAIAGSDAAHNNLQPYIVVAIWKRTA